MQEKKFTFVLVFVFEKLEDPYEQLPDVKIEQELLIAIDLHDFLLASMLIAKSLLFYDLLASTITVSLIFHYAKAMSGVIAVLEALLAKQGLDMDLAIKASVAYIELILL